MFPFENSSVSSFIPDNRKYASGAMKDSAAAATVPAESATEKTETSGVTSLSRGTGWLVAFFTVLSIISLLLCFNVPSFFFVHVLLFQRVVNFKRVFLENKITSNPVVEVISKKIISFHH